MPVEIIVLPRRIPAALRRLRTRLALAWLAASLAWLAVLAAAPPLTPADPLTLAVPPLLGGLVVWSIGWIWRPGHRRSGLQRSLG